jgi:SNF2 family DNA or RNA helicase
MATALKYSNDSALYGLFRAEFSLAESARRLGFERDPRGFWKTKSPFKALFFRDYADASAKTALAPWLRALDESTATERTVFDIPVPDGLSYLPFQEAGIVYAARRSNCLLADEPGLGKTIQAIGLANLLELRRLLVICPAGLRLNWAREIEKWHIGNPGVEVLLTGKNGAGQAGRSVVTSYDLADCVERTPFDLVVVDEAHYVKNWATQRAQTVLGIKGSPGLIALSKRRLALTGTPIPNRVNEIYPVLRAMVPGVIDSMSYRAFIQYSGIVEGEGRVIGVKREEELYYRLRAGCMVRRLKKDVLKDLPEKTYKLVVFPKDSATAKVLLRERQFSAAEILKHGAPVGTALPEIRREMGIAKVPKAIQYILDLIEQGVRKVVVYAHHRDVVSLLSRGLMDHHPVVVSGETAAGARQNAVDRFQEDPKIKIFIGNIVAAGVGITLTAAKDVVFVECSWVPGENEQAEDRVHRVGQRDGVTVHQLVVQESLDAAILGAAARKRADIFKILQGETQNEMPKM